MKTRGFDLGVLLGIVVILNKVTSQTPNTWKEPANRQRQKMFDFTQLFLNRAQSQMKQRTYKPPVYKPPAFKPTFPEVQKPVVDRFTQFVTRGHYEGSENYHPYPATFNQQTSSVPSQFLPPNIADPPDYGPNDAYILQQRSWGMSPYMQQPRQVGARPQPVSPISPAPSAQPGVQHQPVPVPQPLKPGNPFRPRSPLGAAVAAASGAYPVCRPTVRMPMLCDISGESNLNYRLRDVMKAITSMKKVPQCYRNIPRVSCDTYYAAQHIWREGFCYCKYFKNNAHLYGSQQLECVLNDCGACTQEFYVGDQRIICD